MADVLDQLRGWGGGESAPRPEPVDALRARNARRRRRRRLTVAPVVAIGAVALVLIGAAVITDDPERGTVATEAGPTSTSAAPSTSTTTEPQPADVGALPGRRTRVVSGPSGVLVTAPDGDLPPTRVTNQPTRVAFGVGDGLLVAQLDASGSPGAVVVFEAGGERTLLEPANAGEYVQLLDAGIANGRPQAVATTSGGPSPAEWDVRLLLVDLLTGDRTDLGSVGGWEEGVSHARLLPLGDVVLLQPLFGGDALELRSNDGSTAWRVDSLGADVIRALALVEGHERLGPSVLIVEPGFEGADFVPTLRVRGFAVTTGEETRSDPPAVPLAPEPGAELVAGFCHHVAYADLTTVFCDQSAGPEVRIDYAEGTITREPGAPAEGTMTFWRFGP